jgi:integrase
VVVKRGKKYHICFRRNKKVLSVATDTNSKREAGRIEEIVKHVVRTGDYSTLDHPSRLVCIRLFKNRGWELPDALITPPGGESLIEPEAKKELTLWKAIELCLKYPDIRDSSKRHRMQSCFVHLVEKLGKNRPIKEIRIPQIKQYRVERLAEGAAPATVNKEKSTLSKMLQVLVEMELIEQNYARRVPNLSEKSGERQVYISQEDFHNILDNLPEWYRPVVHIAYCTGMRLGEITGLTRKQVDLSKRIIYLGDGDTKEGRRKRVPIHRDLIPVLKGVMKVRAIGNDLLFLVNGKKFGKDQGRLSWGKAVDKVGFDSAPRFHDLRHTWKTNARRSGMNPEISERIMGHIDKGLSISERYGAISNEELVRAIDGMTFNHGETEIWVANQK